MNTTLWIVTAIEFIFIIVLYFGIAYSVSKEKAKQGLLSLAGLLLISLINLIIIISLVEPNTELKKQNKEKCPEYKKIDNVYILKQ